jgi:hypothetical protein
VSAVKRQQRIPANVVHNIKKMKIAILILVLFISIPLYSQTDSITHFDSVDVRIYNNGKRYIKNLTLTVNNNEYQFTDIWKRKYSTYLKLPFLWPSNQIELTIIVKRMFKYDEWMSMIIMPIDHVGESQFTSGKFTVYAEPRIKKGNLEFDSYIIKE